MTKVSDERRTDRELSDMIQSLLNHGEAGYTYVKIDAHLSALRELQSLRAAPSNPVISDEMVLKACRSMYPTWDVAMTPGDHEWHSKHMHAALTAALSVKPQSGENR